MFERVKQLFRDLSGDEERPFDDADYRVAVAALLVHVADVDGMTTPEEMDRLRQVLAQQFNLDRSAAMNLLDVATRSDEEAVDFYHFTSVLKRRLDNDGRRKVIGLMWEIVYADGVLHELEDNVVFRVAELLGVSTHDRVALRMRAAERAGVVGEHDPSGAPEAFTS